MRVVPLLLLLSVSAQAQPRAEAVVDAWRANWERAERSMSGFTMSERSTHTFEGPRGGRDVEMEAALTYRSGERPQRRVHRVEVGGQEVDPQRDPDSRRRLHRTFGRSGRAVTQPPPLPDRLMAQADARDLIPVRYQGSNAWQITLETERGESTAWFTRSARSPRLLAVRTERDEGRVEREIRYTRVQGLDLPASVTASVTAQQRRRLREYVVTLRVSSAFTSHTFL